MVVLANCMLSRICGVVVVVVIGCYYEVEIGRLLLAVLMRIWIWVWWRKELECSYIDGKAKPTRCEVVSTKFEILRKFEVAPRDMIAKVPST